MISSETNEMHTLKAGIQINDGTNKHRTMTYGGDKEIKTTKIRLTRKELYLKQQGGNENAAEYEVDIHTYIYIFFSKTQKVPNKSIRHTTKHHPSHEHAHLMLPLAVPSSQSR